MINTSNKVIYKIIRKKEEINYNNRDDIMNEIIIIRYTIVNSSLIRM